METIRKMRLTVLCLLTNSEEMEWLGKSELETSLKRIKYS